MLNIIKKFWNWQDKNQLFISKIFCWLTSILFLYNGFHSNKPELVYIVIFMVTFAAESWAVNYKLGKKDY